MKPGTIVWHDLTVDDAAGLRDFYSQLVGWQARPHPMGEYDDFDLTSPAGETVAGLCHARGPNAALPPQWLMYVVVEDADACAGRCESLGGRLLDGPRTMGESRFCVVEDPAGAVLALLSPAGSAAQGSGA